MRILNKITLRQQKLEVLTDTKMLKSQINCVKDLLRFYKRKLNDTVANNSIKTVVPTKVAAKVEEAAPRSERLYPDIVNRYNSKTVHKVSCFTEEVKYEQVDELNIIAEQIQKGEIIDQFECEFQPVTSEVVEIKIDIQQPKYQGAEVYNLLERFADTVLSVYQLSEELKSTINQVMKTNDYGVQELLVPSSLKALPQCELSPVAWNTHGFPHDIKGYSILSLLSFMNVQEPYIAEASSNFCMQIAYINENVEEELISYCAALYDAFSKFMDLT